MKFTVKVASIEKHRTSCLVLPVFDNRKLSLNGEKIDKEQDKVLSHILRQGDCDGKPNQLLLLPSVGDLPAERLLLLGCGKANSFSKLTFKEAFCKALSYLTEGGTTDLSIPLDDFPVTQATQEWKIRQIIQIIHEILYQFDEFKSQKKPRAKKLAQIHFILTHKKELASAQLAIEQGMAIAEGMSMTKNLANRPPNHCTPAFLADEAKRFAKKHQKTSVAVLDKKDLETLKMGSLLSVAQGSIHPPKLITLEYRGTSKKQKPIVLVGKGITFDTGGNSLKPAMNMIGMKFDMSGAASIYGVFKAVEELQLPIHLIGVIAACENMPGPYASRPDDVVTSMSGQTIEILNTDAEGRLILADALSYCERFEPAAVIDIATLTGACIIALGHHYSGLMGNDEKLKQALLKASEASDDPVWELPLAEEYARTLRSETADFSNIAMGDVGAGSIVAGCFLNKFTEKYRWAHLDIAGTACFYTGSKRGASGRPVPLLVQYLIDQCQS